MELLPLQGDDEVDRRVEEIKDRLDEEARRRRRERDEMARARQRTIDRAEVALGAEPVDESALRDALAALRRLPEGDTDAERLAKAIEARLLEEAEQRRRATEREAQRSRAIAMAESALADGGAGESDLAEASEALRSLPDQDEEVTRLTGMLELREAEERRRREEAERKRAGGCRACPRSSRGRAQEARTRGPKEAGGRKSTPM